jgi:hypothetical protein
MHPFEIRPSPLTVQTPDELMILWGNTPRGSAASLYLPAVGAAEILSLADSMYESHLLTMEDAHTIQCPVGGVTFVPIPKGRARIAGLMTVDLPAGIPKGEALDIVVRQIIEASGEVAAPPPQQPQPKARELAVVTDKPGRSTWRELLGAFQITITINTKAQLLHPEERLLARLRWIQQAISIESHWYLDFQRYVSQIAGRVSIFGGNPGQIVSSPTGNVAGHKPEPGHPGHPFDPGEPEGHRLEFIGKVAGVIYDRFGDFQGFHLRTEHGHEASFKGREQKIELLIGRAWLERILITVFADPHKPHWPSEIVLREPPNLR